MLGSPFTCYTSASLVSIHSSRNHTCLAGECTKHHRSVCCCSSGASHSNKTDPVLSVATNSGLVQCIFAGEFVEMRELLADTIALHDQLESVHGPLQSLSTPGSFRVCIREVPLPISWAYCLVAYVAVRTHDSIIRDMLACTYLIIRKAMCHGGGGWQEYARSFRSQATIDPTLR